MQLEITNILKLHNDLVLTHRVTLLLLSNYIWLKPNIYKLYYTLKDLRKTLCMYCGQKLIALWTTLQTYSVCIVTLEALFLLFFSQKVLLDLAEQPYPMLLGLALQPNLRRLGHGCPTGPSNNGSGCPTRPSNFWKKQLPDRVWSAANKT